MSTHLHTEEKELECVVRGKVQMVMFRDFTQRHARSLGLHGMVRNRKDGTVHILAQGREDVLTRFLKKLSKGPLLARVAFVSVHWKKLQQPFQGFSIQYD